jgi:hypothetical protein
MEESPHQERLGSWTRGIFIAALIVAYGWFIGHPQGSFAQMFVVGAAIQILVIVVRKLVPSEHRARAQYVFEMVADGVTVLVFALGVFGGIARTAAAV